MIEKRSTFGLMIGKQKLATIIWISAEKPSLSQLELEQQYTVCLDSGPEICIQKSNMYCCIYSSRDMQAWLIMRRIRLFLGQCMWNICKFSTFHLAPGAKSEKYSMLVHSFVLHFFTKIIKKYSFHLKNIYITDFRKYVDYV